MHYSYILTLYKIYIYIYIYIYKFLCKYNVLPRPPITSRDYRNYWYYPLIIHTVLTGTVNKKSHSYTKWQTSKSDTKYQTSKSDTTFQTNTMDSFTTMSEVICKH